MGTRGDELDPHHEYPAPPLLINDKVQARLALDLGRSIQH
jgi:hypothetical protein